MKPETAADCVAVLVVHGIGEQKRGETLDKLLRGLRRVEGASVLEQNKDSVFMAIGGRPVRFYEVHWADELMGKKMVDAFRWGEVLSLAWFPWFNWVRGNYQKGCYSFLKIAWWCVALPIFNLGILCAYYGVGAVGVLLNINKMSLDGIKRILDEYAGDVFTYVNSAGNAFYWRHNKSLEHVYAKIMDLFYAELVKAAASCATIQIVAHSLGTVVTYHALSGLQFEPYSRERTEAIRAARAKVRHIYTIGSPLEKIKFFWPRLVQNGRPFGEMKTQWDNFVSWFDPVAGTLKRFDDWGKVCNHRLLGAGFVLGHVLYERSAVFLNAFLLGLIGKEVPLKRTVYEQALDLLILAVETIVEPIVFAFFLAVGAGMVVGVAALGPELFSLLVRWWLPPKTWGAIADTATLIILGVILILFALVPAIGASRAHARYWAAAPPEPRKD
jgi:hypothetical protein